MNFGLICVLTYLIVQSVKSEMSEKQLKSATNLIRKVCQPKTKVSTAQIDAMHNGDFPQDRALMCYMECCLRTGRLMKDGQLDFDSLMSQASNLPESRRALTIASANKCKNAAKSADKCEAGFEIYKCFYDDNAENFFLP